jgi:3-mercaptopyruvate sulfurtransferase SseA
MSPVQSIPAVTPIEERGYAHPEVLVSTDWVAQHLDDPKVRLVESNEDLLLYDTGHIPGAVFADWRHDFTNRLFLLAIPELFVPTAHQSRN